MLTNPRDAFRGQSRSPNIIRYVRHCFQLVCYSNFVPTTPCFSGTRLHSMATMSLSHTVCMINSDFSRKSQIFHTSGYFAPSLKGLPLELGTGARDKKTRMMGLPGRERSLTIFSAIWIQYTNVTDRRTDTGRQQRPRLRIASRGKNQT